MIAPRAADGSGRSAWTPLAYDTRTLPNGLEVICATRPVLSRAVVTLLVRVGSRFETRENNGVSHFLEHMLYRGCPSKATAHEQALAFEELGASLYGATQTDFGTFSLSLPPESLGEAFALFAEVAEEPRFSAIETERGIVREEILEDLDDHGRQVDPDNLVRALMFKTHPLGYAITGTLDTLGTFDREMLSAHHARHYTAANSVLCFSGAVDPHEAFDLAERHFSRLPSGVRVPVSAPPFRQKRPRVQHVDNVSSQTSLRVAFRAVSEKDPREPAAEMLLRVLDDGMSTRLYERICDAQGLCYDVSALFECYEDDGVFDVAADVQHERAAEVLREILGLAQELARSGPTERELERAKARNLWQMRAMLDDAEATGGFFALAALADIVRTPMQRHEELAGVTRRQVRDVARAIFRPERLSVVSVGSLAEAQRRALDELAGGFQACD